MRILHILSQTELTGAEVYAKNLIEHQHNSKHEVFVISQSMHVDIPVPWKSLKLASNNRLERMKNILTIRDFLKENRIEVIHCHSRGAVRHAHWARLGLPVAMVTTLHGRQHYSFSKKLLNIYGELMIAVCQNVRTSTSKQFAIHPDQIQVLPNPVVTPENQMKATALTMALIGRSTGPKGRRFEELAKNNFQKWLQDLPDLKIDIIVPNTNGFSKGFLDFIEHLNTQFNNRIQILGHVTKLFEHMRRYQLVIASGRVAVEALQQKISLLAFGEYHQHGIVNKDNIQLCIDSNFGDMGANELEIPLNTAEVYSAVLNFFKTNPASDNEILQQISKNHFSSVRINEQIVQIYQRSIFKRSVPHWIPILMYHKVPDLELNSKHRIFVTRSKFEKHLQFFKKNQFTTLTLQELADFIYLKKDPATFPKKPLVLSFDDGYRDNLTNAEPLLKKYNMKATIFLLANHEILENTWDTKDGDTKSEIMSFEEKKRLDPQVWEIASHGFDHLKLPEVSKELATKELYQSRVKLEKEFQKPVISFAYPFGVRSDAIAELASDAKYLLAVNTDQGGLHVADNPFSIFRVNIFPEETRFSLKKKTSSWYRKYFFKKRNR